ncbi:MAG: hypothetical protein QJR14_05445, partial [Bacillota bacterium]|nr:hypothetical protein [Bacillota bacterium]
QDFEGFPQAWYRVRYEPLGEPRLAKQITHRALEAGLPVRVSEELWGLDHGAWTPLLYLFPDADVPVVSLSMALHFGHGRDANDAGSTGPSLEAGAEAHRRLGAAVAQAAEDLGLRIGFLATGALTHRLDLWGDVDLQPAGGGGAEARRPPEPDLTQARPYDREVLTRLLEHRWTELEAVDPALRREAAPEGDNRPLETLLGALAAEEERIGRPFDTRLLSYEEAFGVFSLSTLLFRPRA